MYSRTIIIVVIMLALLAGTAAQSDLTLRWPQEPASNPGECLYVAPSGNLTWGPCLTIKDVLQESHRAK